MPAPLQAALAGPVLPASTVLTDAFISVTTSLAKPALASDVRAAYHLPYETADRRGGVGGFVVCGRFELEGERCDGLQLEREL